jgi:hypothetical protein
MALAPVIWLEDFMSTAVPAQREWIKGGFLPKGGKTIIASWAKAGKSWATLQLIKDVCYGNKVFGHPTLEVEGEPRILYIDQEVGQNAVHDRIKTHVFKNCNSIPPRRFASVSREPALMLDSFQGMRAMRQYLDQVQPNILILDPLSKIMQGDDSSNVDVRAFFRNIDELLNEYKQLDLSVVITHHNGKPPNETPKNKLELLDPYKMRGASQFFNDVDAAMMMWRDPENLKPGWRNVTSIRVRHGIDFDPFELYVNHFEMGAQYLPYGG